MRGGPVTDIAPNIKIPLEIRGGKFVTLEQDSPEEIMQCAKTVVSTEVGTRTGNLEFGVPDQTFRQGGPDPAAVRAALDRWEPRANAIVETEPDALNELVNYVNVGVAVGPGEADG